MQDTTTTTSNALTQLSQTGTAPDVPPSTSFRDYLTEDGTRFAQNWTQRLPDPYRQHEKTLAKFTGPLELAAGYANLEKRLGERIKPPGADAKPEEIEAWRALNGVPKTPEDYGLKAPENLPEGVVWNDGLAKDFAGLAHKHHLPPAAVQELIAFHNGNLAKMQEGATQQQRAVVAQAKEDLQREWGGDAGRNSVLAVKMAQTLGLDPNDEIVANNPKIIAALYRASEMLTSLTREDQRLVDGGQASWGQSAETQLQKIRSSDDYQGRNGPEKQQAAAAQMKRVFDSTRG
ncbi:MAG: hypothetical protein U0984_18070 [Prosthecobacter sp.]|nr:hypothetical protein [Prosthecobacter sp.]